MAVRKPLVINAAGEVEELAVLDTLPDTIVSMATSRILGRLTAGTGGYEVLTPGNARTILDLTGETGSGNVVKQTTPTLITPNIGAATGISLVVTGTITGGDFFYSSGSNAGMAIDDRNSGFSERWFFYASGGVNSQFHVYSQGVNKNLVNFSKVGNMGIGEVAAWGTSATNTFGIPIGTEPSTSPADLLQIFCYDISAGNATLGLRTERALVTETVTSDRTLTIRHNGVTIRLCCKS